MCIRDRAPALFLTPTGVQLLWPREVNRFLSLIHIYDKMNAHRPPARPAKHGKERGGTAYDTTDIVDVYKRQESDSASSSVPESTPSPARAMPTSRAMASAVSL